jgi:hypothetical protein
MQPVRHRVSRRDRKNDKINQSAWAVQGQEIDDARLENSYPRADKKILLRLLQIAGYAVSVDNEFTQLKSVTLVMTGECRRGFAIRVHTQQFIERKVGYKICKRKHDGPV